MSILKISDSTSSTSKSRTFLPSVLTLSVLTIFHSAYADSPAEVDHQLSTIVVTASRLPQAINVVPASISVITQAQLQQSPSNELSNLLRQDPALNVVSLGGYGQQTSVFTRGTNSNQTLFLLDGVRLNPSTTSIANVQFFDTSDLSQVEILKGPASVQYGSDAVGGVIQLITTKPTQQKFFTTFEGGNNNLYKAIVGADLVQNDAYLQVRGQTMGTDGSNVTTIAQDKSGYDQKGYSVKGGVDNDQYALAAEVRGNQGKSNYVGYDYSSPQSQDFNNRLINLTGRYTVAQNLNVNLRLSQYLDTLNQNDSTDFAHTRQNEVDTNVRWGFAPNQTLLAGLTARNTDVNYLNGMDEYKRTLGTTGYYVQHQYQDSIFSTQAGVRLEDNHQFGTHTTGQLAGRMQVLPSTSVYTNIGTAFHAPDGNQLFSSFGGNSDLKPEESTSYEIGVDQTIIQGLVANLSVYRTDVKNLITYDKAFNLANINKAQLTGGEAGLKWNFEGGWFTNVAYGYVQPIAEGQNGKKDSELTRRPRRTFNVSTGLQRAQYGFSAEITTKSEAKDYNLNYPISGYAVGNLHGYIQAMPNVRVFANIENVTNRKYPVALAGDGTFGSTLSYYLAARRQATLGVTVNY
jgi:vitamin B12 transporter